MKRKRDQQWAPALWGYSMALGAGLALSAPWWLLRMLTARRYHEGLPERLGRVPDRLRAVATGSEIIWLHAVSVGEVLAASRLVEELEAALRARQTGSSWKVVISTTTRTGQALARERFGAARVFWFPLDFAWSTRAWLQVLKPRLLVLMESELWPRLLAECSRRGIPVAVANARISDRSFRRAQHVRRLWTRVLQNVSLFLPQSEETARRLLALGVTAEKLTTAGNLKYDIEPRQTGMVRTLRNALGRSPLVVAGSLLEGEEALLLNAWKEVHAAAPGTVLVLAPRHPERFNAVAKLVEESYPLLRASRLHAGDMALHQGRLRPETVVLLDTVGDLAGIYGLADVAFVGGSLVPRGGHNPLEPARWGVPVLIGPSFENFREVVAEMQTFAGIEIVHDGGALSRALQHLLRDFVAADELGQRGQQVFARRSGATARTVAALLPLALSSASSATEAYP